MLTGRKLWITNGNEADLFLVFANINPEAGYRGITGVPRRARRAGLHRRQEGRQARHPRQQHVRAAVRRLPRRRDSVLGEVGKGYKVAIETLNEGRIGIGAQMIGLAQGALDHAIRYTKERRQFGKAIADFQGVQFQLARMAIDVESARLLVYNAARLRDAGLPFLHEAAMCKIFSSEVAERVTSMAVNLYGGYGFVRDYPVEKLYRDAKIGQIYEGTSNMQLHDDCQAAALVKRSAYGSRGSRLEGGQPGALEADSRGLRRRRAKRANVRQAERTNGQLDLIARLNGSALGGRGQPFDDPAELGTAPPQRTAPRFATRRAALDHPSRRGRTRVQSPRAESGGRSGSAHAAERNRGPHRPGPIGTASSARPCRHLGEGAAPGDVAPLGTVVFKHHPRDARWHAVVRIGRLWRAHRHVEWKADLAQTRFRQPIACVERIVAILVGDAADVRPDHPRARRSRARSAARVPSSR